MNRRRHLSALVVFVMLLGLVLSLPVQALAKVNTTSITLNHSEKDVDVGSGFMLNATVTSVGAGKITWITNNSYVATVSASGYVRGNHPGTAVITATHTDINGVTTSATCTVYVTVPDGLYYIKNASSDLCLYTGGSAVSIQSQETNADGRLSRLWKITYVSGGRYEINPIRDTSVALTADSANYVTVRETESAACWGILHNAFGYSIQYFGSSSESAKPIVADMPGSQIYLGDWQSNMTCHWELEQAYGIFLRDTKTKEIVGTSAEKNLGIGRTCSLADLGISYECYGTMSGGMTWSSNNSNIISVGTSGQLTAVNSGVARITVRATLSGVAYSYSCYVNAESTVLVLSNSDEDWINSSQTMGANMVSAVGVEVSAVQAVYTDDFADTWNSTTSDHVIIHTHGSPGSLSGDGFVFSTEDVSELERNSAIGFVLITSCSTGGENDGESNIAALLSQYIAQDGIVVCCTTIVSGGDTNFTATDNGEWIAYRNGVQIPCDLPTTITMGDVADFWEEFK